MADFNYNVLEDHTFDEKGSTFLSLRLIQWGVPQGETDEESPIRVDLRKWNIRDGKEMPNHGFSFLTDQGPHELTHTLIDCGYGETRRVLQGLSKRDDFRESVETMYDEDVPNDGGDYYDPRKALLGGL